MAAAELQGPSPVYIGHTMKYILILTILTASASDSERGEVLEMVEYGFYDTYSECWLDGSAMEHRYQGVYCAELYWYGGGKYKSMALYP